MVAALELFGSRGFSPVAVGSIAERAGVTTGSLYHHFGSKAGLYRLVRADVEQRVIDRLEGAAAGREVTTLADLAPILLVGFDYLVASDFTLLLAEPPPEPVDGSAERDPIERFVADAIATGAAPVGMLIAAAWRAALSYASHGPDQARQARIALGHVLTGLESSTGAVSSCSAVGQGEHLVH